jgi:hypothetical protein
MAPLPRRRKAEKESGEGKRRRKAEKESGEGNTRGKHVFLSYLQGAAKNSEYTSSHSAASVANGMLLRIESHFYDQGAAPDWSYSDVDTHTSKLFSAEGVRALPQETSRGGGSGDVGQR